MAGTRSVRVVWLCFELDLTVEIEPIDFSVAYRNTPEWRRISPAGKVPVMTDGDMTMFESGAMIAYILERYGNGRLHPAPGTKASAIYHQWCWFAEATLLRPLGLNKLMRSGASPDDAEQKARDCLRVVNRAVADRNWLMGSEFTAADIMIGYSLYLIENLDLLDDEFPILLAYVERLKSRQGFQHALSV